MGTQTGVAVGDVDAALRRELVRSLAAPVGSMSALALAIALVPVRTHLARPAVVVPFAVLVLAVTLTGGGWAGCSCAGVAGLAVDSFLERPYGVLDLDQLSFWTTTAGFLAVAVVVASVIRHRRVTT